MQSPVSENTCLSWNNCLSTHWILTENKMIVPEFSASISLPSSGECAGRRAKISSISTPWGRRGYMCNFWNFGQWPSFMPKYGQLFELIWKMEFHNLSNKLPVAITCYYQHHLRSCLLRAVLRSSSSFSDVFQRVSEWVNRDNSRLDNFSLAATGTKFIKIDGLIYEQGRICR